MASHGEPLNSSGMERMRLILIGKTGSGKSTTANTILGVELFKSQAGINSETKDCGVAIGIRNGREILVMDTPGLCDTDGDDDVIATRITQSLFHVAPGPHAVILVLRCDARFTEEEEKVFHMLNDMLGDKMTSYLIIIFVGKDNLDYDNINFEKQLKQSKRLQRVLEQAGNRYLLFNNKGTEVEKAQMVEDLMQMVEQIVTENDKSCFEHKMADKVNKAMANMMKEEIQQMSEALPAMREQNKPANPMLNDQAQSGRIPSLESDKPLTSPTKVAPKTKPKPKNPYRCAPDQTSERQEEEAPDQTRRIGSQQSSDFKGTGDFQGLAHAERETMHRKKDLHNLQRRGTVKNRRSLFEQSNPEPDVEDRRYNKPRTLPRRDFENQQPQESETRRNPDQLSPQETLGAPYFAQEETSWRKSTGSFEDVQTTTSQDSVHRDYAAQKEEQDVHEDETISSGQDVKTTPSQVSVQSDNSEPDDEQHIQRATSRDSTRSDSSVQNNERDFHEDKPISSWQDDKTATPQDSVHSDNSEPDDEQHLQTATSHDSTSSDSSVQNNARDVHEDRTISYWQDVKTATPQDAVDSDNSKPDDDQDVLTATSQYSDRSNINVQNETRDVHDDRAIGSWQDVQAAASQDSIHSDINAQHESQDGNEDRSIVLRQHVKTTMPRDIIRCSWIEKDMEEVLDKLEDQFVQTLKCHNDSGFNYEIPDKPKLTKVEQRRLVEDVLRKKINNPQELSKAQREQLGEIVKTVGQKIKEGKTKFNLNSLRKCSLM